MKEEFIGIIIECKRGHGMSLYQLKIAEQYFTKNLEHR